MTAPEQAREREVGDVMRIGPQLGVCLRAAPNAKVVVVGYPQLNELGACSAT
ncbi:hypothetical protein [Saccharopolyspora phatthalungensis]|uniref:Uncharacterized protein n=1 Tax=Saccharopolyspora phatthalungensis TaxID=664693 RepID=A0A840Q8G0_9PSEU|nr:hypothetical protein [Saccharopolyspora phatthalungensis]MBB5156736.1 hypothetical protein [Saccharopolyspora phatthalungensis]